MFIHAYNLLIIFSVSAKAAVMEDTAWKRHNIDSLNEETECVSSFSGTNTVTITSIADFVCALKLASKNPGAFDDLDETQGKNILLGGGDGEGDHFDTVMAELLARTGYESAFAEDLACTDALGNFVEYRVNMYTPLYY